MFDSISPLPNFLSPSRRGYIQSGASGHSLGFKDKNLGSSPGLLAQLVATVEAHQPGNSTNPHLQNLANDQTPRCVVRENHNC